MTPAVAKNHYEITAYINDFQGRCMEFIKTMVETQINPTDRKVVQ